VPAGNLLENLKPEGVALCWPPAEYFSGLGLQQRLRTTTLHLTTHTVAPPTQRNNQRGEFQMIRRGEFQMIFDRPSGTEGCTGKKRLRPAVKRAMVAEVMTSHALSQRRACGLSASRDAVFSRPRRQIGIFTYVNGCANGRKSGAVGVARCSI
jgi:hypothetical protein